MGCCGQRREETKRAAMPSPARRSDGAGYSAGAAPVVPPRQRVDSRHEYAPTSVRLRYLERSPILVKGPASGKEYRFSGADPVQIVDLRDADALLRTGFFSRRI
jgi:hypothetical protein